jgi:NAD(P)-dependent dehydrogenase (short-subunit alcohol dehydrogenase family)
MAKRVAIITDATAHLGPDLARKLAAKDHDLVLGAPGEGMVDDLRALGATVAVADGIKGPECLVRPDAVPSLIDLATAEFGGFNAAFVRPDAHITGDILTATAADMQAAFDGNMMAGFYALQPLIKALIAAGQGGQILIGSSSVGVKPYPSAIAYSAAKAGVIMLVQNAAQTAAPHGITVNAIGTMALNYPGFMTASG